MGSIPRNGVEHPRIIAILQIRSVFAEYQKNELHPCQRNIKIKEKAVDIAPNGRGGGGAHFLMLSRVSLAGCRSIVSVSASFVSQDGASPPNFPTMVTPPP